MSSFSTLAFEVVKVKNYFCALLLLAVTNMLRLASISGSRGDSSPYVVSSPTISNSNAQIVPHRKVSMIKEQFQFFLGALSPRSPMRGTNGECYEFPDVTYRPQHQQQKIVTTSKEPKISYVVNSVSNTRELAFGAFDDGNRSALRKKQKAYRKRCLGRIVFTLLVFAVALAVFFFRLKTMRQEERLRDYWAAANVSRILKHI